ncbi:hypothetical protein M3197_09145 [Sporosarcina aquimarina]|uniref:hypothetical protein n=1 Tax=Sporosarcina aquimarina TaxID=114975 RepID=UPI0020403AB0|nr:hypothetical protein [Sporosarcina aquimarina]MCM3757654.1 hypothetical protein [Sporosarcina aquimarina]
MKKYYASHSLIVVIFTVVLLYSLMSKLFIPVLIAAIIGIPLIILNQKKNHPQSKSGNAKMSRN